jgi:hypothetical protein
MKLRVLAIAAAAALYFLLGAASCFGQTIDGDAIRRHTMIVFVQASGVQPRTTESLARSLPQYNVTSFSADPRHPTVLGGVNGTWYIATPKQDRFAPRVVDTPWDEAFAMQARLRPSIVAGRKSAHIYVEPNVESLLPSEADGEGPMPPDWPNGGHFAWHLDAQFSQLGAAREHARVDGCIPRITILDTGIDPDHESTPRHLQTALQYNFYDGDIRGIHNVTDPGTSDSLIKNPTHGTGTISILAGGRVTPSQQNGNFVGDLGGAPEALVVPVRVADSVVHLWTKEMAQGIDYVTKLPGAGGSAGAVGNGQPNYCDVISISAGGLPSRKWASSVNEAYEKGIVIVAAAGNNFRNLPTGYSVYPARFSRVVSVTGVMADYTPYLAPDKNAGSMQGSSGPDSVMYKNIAAYTPNIPWAKWGTKSAYDLDGAGTSAATPQVAAAIALWLQSHASQDHIPLGPQRVEASSQAIFATAARGPGHGSDVSHFGRGLLKADDAINFSFPAGKTFPKQPEAEVSWAFWRTLFGLSEAGMSDYEKMIELEALQTALQSADLAKQTGDIAATNAENTRIRPEISTQFLAQLAASPNISRSLKQYILTREAVH